MASPNGERSSFKEQELLQSLLTAVAASTPDDAARVIDSMCQSSEIWQQHVAELDGTPSAAMLLANPDLPTASQEAVACLMFGDTASSEAAEQHLLGSNGMQPFLSLLRSSERTNQEFGTLAARPICQRSSAVSREFIKQGGLQLLVDVLLSSTSSAACRHHATLAIQHTAVILQDYCCSGGHPPCDQQPNPSDQRHEAVGADEPLEPFIKMLCSSSAQSQEAALGAIQAMCKDATDPGAITRLEELGGLEPIIGLLSCSIAVCQEAAAAIIKAIGPHIFSEQEMTAISGFQLISILMTFPRQQCSAAAQALAATFHGTKGGVSVQLPLQDVQQALIGLLESASKTSQEAALMTLAAVCNGHGVAGRKLATLGAIPLLIRSLSSPSEILQGHAAEALAAVCEGSIANQQQATDLGAVNPLAQMLQSGSVFCQEKAAQGLAVMFRGEPALIPLVLGPLISQLSSPLLEEQIRAAAAINAIGGDADDSSQRAGEHFAVLHGMEALAALLTTASGAGLQITAQAVCSMHWSMRQDGKVSMAQPESFRAIASLLNSPSEASQLQASAAIIALCKAFTKVGPPHEHAAAEALVKLGALQPLIRLLSSCSTRYQESAAAAIAALCTWGHASLELARLDGLQALVAMLCLAPAASTVSHLAALRTIESICDNARDPVLMSQFERLGGLQKIVQLLSCASDTCRAAAAALTRSLCRRGIAQAVAASCGPQLINLLSDSNMPCQTAAALAIKTIFDWITGDPPAQMPMPAVLQPLIDLLSASSSPDCQGAAVSAITAVCLRQKSAAKAYLAARNGAPLIVQLLRSPSTECQGHAAEAITVICQGDVATQQLVIDQHGPQHLVSVLTSSAAASQREAAEALAVLCRSRPAISEQTVQSLLFLLLSPFEADWRKAAAAIDAVSEQAGGTENMLLQQFIDRGGMQALVALLVCTTGCCQQDIARVIHAVYASVTQHAEVEAVLEPSFQLLRHLLCSASVACQERVAAAISIVGQISNSGSRSQRVQWHIASLGDLDPLVALLSSPSARCQARAAEAMCELCQWEGGGGHLWVRLGSVPLLVNMLQSADPWCQQKAAATIRCIGAPMRYLGELQSDACLQSLMALMASSHSGCCQEAVDLLGSMDRHRQARFIDLGGLQSLSALLKASGIGCQRACARALYKLCLLEGSVKARDEIGGMDGLEVLVCMLTLPYDGGAAESAAVVAALANGRTHAPQMAVPFMRGAAESTGPTALRLQHLQQQAVAAAAASSVPNQQRLLDLGALQPFRDMLGRVGTSSRRSQLKAAVQKAVDQLAACANAQ